METRGVPRPRSAVVGQAAAQVDTGDSFAGLGVEWLEAIPPITLRDVLQYVIDTWDDLKAEWPDEHCFSHNEPTLSLSLGQALNEAARKKGAGISGGFGAEAFEPVRINGKVKKNGRTDIKFVFGGTGAPEMILECKKLDGSGAKRSLYFSEGVSRFVSGKYGSEYFQGVMLGFSKHEPSDEAVALKALISSPNSATSYRCIQFPNGEWALDPSELSPGLAYFDTKHDRTPVGASPFDLAHVLLRSPELTTSS